MSGLPQGALRSTAMRSLSRAQTATSVHRGDTPARCSNTLLRKVEETERSKVPLRGKLAQDTRGAHACARSQSALRASCTGLASMSRRAARCFTDVLLRLCVPETDVAVLRCAPVAVQAHASRACAGQRYEAARAQIPSSYPHSARNMCTSSSVQSTSDGAAAEKGTEQAPQDQVSAMAEKVMQDAAEQAHRGQPEKCVALLTLVAPKAARAACSDGHPAKESTCRAGRRRCCSRQTSCCPRRSAAWRP